MNRRTVIPILCCMMLLAGAARAATTIDPSDPNILYTGRWDISDSSPPWSYWIGASVIARFEGTGIAATMSGGYSGNPDYFRIIVDDDAANSTKISVPLTPATYTLASDLADTVHKVEIIKETDVGSWTFNSFQLDDDRSLADPPARPPRKIAFYGDSNLAGSSLESEENESASHLRGTYYGLAGVVSRMFDAEYHNVSRSGAGVSDIHGVFDQVSYWSSTPTCDFNDFPADVVVVNLGANDVGSPVHRIKSDYNAFLDDLRAAYPSAHIMLYNGWGWDYDEPANFTHEVIADRGDPNMSVAIFPWVFEQWHGCEYDHAGMAQILADHLTAVLGWSQGPRDVMNGFGMNGDLANGSFEEVAPFGGYGWRYYTHSGVSRVHDPAWASDGKFYLRLSNGASSHQPIPAEDGETFTVVLWMRSASDGDEVEITMDFRDQEMWTTPLQTETETRSLTTDWQQYSMTATAPTGTANPVFHTRVTFTAGAGDTVDIDDVAMTTAAGVPGSQSPPEVRWLSVGPNPFGPSASIEFVIPRAGSVLLSVHDVSGRQVTILADGHYQGGKFVETWDGRDLSGREVGSGIYFARMAAGEVTATTKMVLIR